MTIVNQELLKNSALKIQYGQYLLKVIGEMMEEINSRTLADI